jgi:hypothetical protein
MIIPDKLKVTLYELPNQGKNGGDHEGGKVETFYGPYKNSRLPDWQGKVSGILVEYNEKFNA